MACSVSAMTVPRTVQLGGFSGVDVSDVRREQYHRLRPRLPYVAPILPPICFGSKSDSCGHRRAPGVAARCMRDRNGFHIEAWRGQARTSGRLIRLSKHRLQWHRSRLLSAQTHSQCIGDGPSHGLRTGAPALSNLVRARSPRPQPATAPQQAPEPDYRPRSAANAATAPGR